MLIAPNQVLSHAATTLGNGARRTAFVLTLKITIQTKTRPQPYNQPAFQNPVEQQLTTTGETMGETLSSPLNETPTLAGYHDSFS
jgi:hypothetical protein